MKTTEIERRIAALESRQSGKFESGVVLELPEKAYQPIYPPTPAKRLFRELPDSTPGRDFVCDTDNIQQVGWLKPLTPDSERRMRSGKGT